METVVIDWESDTPKPYLNPRMPAPLLAKIHKALDKFVLPGHFWIATSGTSAVPKLVALSRDAMLTSGKAVNHHFDITDRDVWLNILPLFHVGGLGIHARAKMSGAAVYDYSDEKWDPKTYWELLNKHRVSWSSLVPTQVYDLVQLNLKAPSSLRGIIIGGGAMQESLHAKAKELGWSLHRSYGMTECCSQVATAKSTELNAPLIPLEHINIRIADGGLIEIRSPSLLTAYLHYDCEEPQLIDPKRDGWFRSEDRGELVDGCLYVSGRGEQFLKIGGESIDFTLLEKIWEDLKLEGGLTYDTALIDLPDERLGQTVNLAVAGDQSLGIEPLVERFNSRVLPVAKIRQIHYLAELPRTPLKKLLKNELRQKLQ